MAEVAHMRDFMVRDCQGKDCKLGDLLQRVTLIVNIDCKIGGSANSECKDLQDIYVKHKSRGLEVLAFPSDQFQYVSDQGQHLTAAEVKADLCKRYNVTFPIMSKVNVNGDTAHPLFMYLQKRLSGFPTNAIKWDFTKFLIVNGEPQKRYGPTSMLSTIESDINHILGHGLTKDVKTSQKSKGTRQTVRQGGKTRMEVLPCYRTKPIKTEKKATPCEGCDRPQRRKYPVTSSQDYDLQGRKVTPYQ